VGFSILLSDVTVMLANFWFAKGQGVLAGQNHDVVWMIIFVVLAGLHAECTMGFDEKLSGKYRFLA
jgi:uncharacterized membrane protein YagU involved in acid resistance